MPTFNGFRWLACAVICFAVLPTVSAPWANAGSLVRERTLQRRHLQHRIVQVHRAGSGAVHRLAREASKIERAFNVVSPRSMNSGRWKQVQRRLGRRSRHLTSAIRRIQHRTLTRIAQLRRQVNGISGWLAVWGVFRTCPVAGAHTVNDDFGATVRQPGVPVHVHQGNDITANTGTPIVAPFDGRAVASSSTFGGVAVKVYGAAGYVYNAHLSAYGHLGVVHAGEVVGYVGSTGDASGPHDHFEWHPRGGPAVDPNGLLSAVC